MQRQPEAAAHGNAVDQGNDGFRVARQGEVEMVFGKAVAARAVDIALHHPAMHGGNVAAGAKGPPADRIQDDEVDGRIGAPVLKRQGNAGKHRLAQHIEGARAVQRDPPGAALPPHDEFAVRRGGAQWWMRAADQAKPAPLETTITLSPVRIRFCSTASA